MTLDEATWPCPSVPRPFGAWPATASCQISSSVKVHRGLFDRRTSNVKMRVPKRRLGAHDGRSRDPHQEVFDLREIVSWALILNVDLRGCIDDLPCSLDLSAVQARAEKTIECIKRLREQSDETLAFFSHSLRCARCSSRNGTYSERRDALPVQCGRPQRHQVRRVGVRFGPTPNQSWWLHRLSASRFYR